MTANIAFYRMFRFIAKNKNMVFVYARFKLLSEFHISFREKAVGIQKVSQSVMQSLPTRRLCGMNQPI